MTHSVTFCRLQNSLSLRINKISVSVHSAVNTVNEVQCFSDYWIITVSRTSSSSRLPSRKMKEIINFTLLVHAQIPKWGWLTTGSSHRGERGLLTFLLSPDEAWLPFCKSCFCQTELLDSVLVNWMNRSRSPRRARGQWRQPNRLIHPEGLSQALKKGLDIYAHSEYA